MPDSKIPQEIRSLMGGRAVVAEDDLPPQMIQKTASQVLPERPKRKGIPPVYPIVPEAELHRYKVAPSRAEDAVVSGTSRSFDPELNELALKEVADSYGMTVEQLLASQSGRKLEEALKPKIEQDEPKETPMPEMSVDLTQLKQQMETLQRQIEVAEKKPEPTAAVQAPEKPTVSPELIEQVKQHMQQEMAAQQAAEAKRLEESRRKAADPLKPRTKAILKSPTMERLRQKLGMSRIKAMPVEIEGIEFMLYPAGPELNTWFLNTISTAATQNTEIALTLILKRATAATVVLSIDGVPLPEALGIIPEGTMQHPLDLPEKRALAVQLFYEMMSGNPTIEGVEVLDPDLGVKISDAFDLLFKSFRIKSSLDPKAHRYLCEVPGCTEQYDLTLEPGTPVFCGVHAAPMVDSGLAERAEKDAASLPL